MSDYSVVKTRIQAGIWEGVITTSGDKDIEPAISVTHMEQPVTSFAVTEDPAKKGQWQLRIAIPPDLLADGVQVFLINDADTGDKLTAFTIVTGEPLDDDVRAELELLRAELDMLKKAFRRHCLETM